VNTEPMMTIASGGLPLYLQIAKGFRQKIANGEIAVGDALPSERDLCEIMGTSRVTVRKAIETLIDEGLLIRKQGSGTFVMPRIEAPGSLVSGFSEDAQARGESVSVIWILKIVALASDEEVQALELSPGDAVMRLSRVRMANGEPFAIENAAVPAAFLGDPDTLGDSLYAALAARGNSPVSGTQKIHASLATSEEARLLCVPEKTEILRIERMTRLADGRPVELTRSAYRGDRYVFVSELRGSKAKS
jgi:GntR family transcriptional regulator